MEWLVSKEILIKLSRMKDWKVFSHTLMILQYVGKINLYMTITWKKLLAAAEKYNLTLNEEKCTFSNKSVHLLGYTIENKTIKPDLDRPKPVMELPIHKDTASLQRALGMFAHFCRWILIFSEKVCPLLLKKHFCLSEEAVSAFSSLKNDVAKATLAAIEDNIPFRVEIEASDFAISATLSQGGCPIAFFSRTFNKSEQKHSSIEKEAYLL
jgi:hypothetical protein